MAAIPFMSSASIMFTTPVMISASSTSAFSFPPYETSSDRYNHQH
jgi:hypothetical protein